MVKVIQLNSVSPYGEIARDHMPDIQRNSAALATVDAAAPATCPDVAIRAERLGKLYCIGEIREKHKTLRETVAGIAAAPFRRLRLTGKPRSRADHAIWALRDVSFEVRRGEVVGIIGRNGAGKSTLLKVLSRITEPTEGRAEIYGRVGSLLDVGTGFHHELTGRENVFLNGAILGMRRAEIQARFDEIVAFAEIEKFIDTAVKYYSSGMYMRLAFAVAAFMEPEILLVDEVLAVGDAAFQKKCLGKMEDVARTGRTVLFVSHNMGAMRSLCSTGILLEEGRVTYSGDIAKCIESHFTQVGAFQVAGRGPQDVESTLPGFGAVVIQGGEGNSISQEQPIEAETFLRVGPQTAGFSLFCILEDMQSRMAFHLREESPDLHLTEVSEGVYSVRVRVPPLWLSAGLYSLYFKAIIWGNAGDARCLSDKIPLDVTGLHSTVGAMLHPGATWNVVPAK